jgi:hypothetical protein
LGTRVLGRHSSPQVDNLGNLLDHRLSDSHHVHAHSANITATLITTHSPPCLSTSHRLTSSTRFVMSPQHTNTYTRHILHRFCHIGQHHPSRPNRHRLRPHITYISGTPSSASVWIVPQKSMNICITLLLFDTVDISGLLTW